MSVPYLSISVRRVGVSYRGLRVANDDVERFYDTGCFLKDFDAAIRWAKETAEHVGVLPCVDAEYEKRKR